MVAVNAARTPIFSEATRVDAIRRALDKAGCKNVTVSSADGLVAGYYKEVGATVIIKDLRQNGDYGAELGMALINHRLAGIEAPFLPADPILEHISSSIVKNVARHGGDMTGMVSDCIVPILADVLAGKYQRKD